MPRTTGSSPDPLEAQLSASLKRQFPADARIPTFTPSSDRTRRTPLLIAAAVAVPLAVAGTLATVELGTDDVPAGSYALPSNGWEPGDGSDAARTAGRFHADRHQDGLVCAWLGATDDPVPTLWPKGWRVRFHPTQLLDDSGKVVADAGDRIEGAGGYNYPLRGRLAECGDGLAVSVTMPRRVP